MGDKAPHGACNESLQTLKHQEQLQGMQSDVLMWENQRRVWSQSPKIKTPFSTSNKREKLRVLRGIVGYRNLIR